MAGTEEDTVPPTTASFINPEEMLAHWQAHRRLTRRVIEAYPDDKLFTFSVGGMRPFGELVLEMLTMAVPMIRGAVTDKWEAPTDRSARPKADLLRLWDDTTEELNTLWPQIPPERFHETMTAFGQYTGLVHGLIFYVVDNEIHHRGQGYVYLRALGVEPPAFYDRS
jgi:uncharacterized damage-inducible protein DinB